MIPRRSISFRLKEFTRTRKQLRAPAEIVLMADDGENPKDWESEKAIQAVEELFNRYDFDFL